MDERGEAGRDVIRALKDKTCRRLQTYVVRFRVLLAEFSDYSQGMPLQ